MHGASNAMFHEWNTNCALLSHFMDQASPETQKELAHALLCSFGKASIINEKACKLLGLQTTPLFPEGSVYHRSTTNELLSTIQDAYAKDMGIKPHELELIQSDLFAEVIDRELPADGLGLNIESFEAFDALIDTLLARAKGNRFPETRIAIDFTKLLNIQKCLPKEIQEAIVAKFEERLAQKLEQFFAENATTSPQDLASKLLSRLHLIAFSSHKNQPVMLIPEFLLHPMPKYAKANACIMTASVQNRHGSFERLISSMMSHAGYRLDPAEAKLAWLEVESLDKILEQTGILKAALTDKSPQFPTLFSNFSQFLQDKHVKAFRQLAASRHAPPYLKILPVATYAMLEGLSHCQIEKTFRDKGIEKLLQAAFIRIRSCMQEAVFRQKDLVSFNNQIEVIHQWIQIILDIAKPHSAGIYQASVVDRLKEPPDPLIPPELGDPQVHLKPSAMHGLSSIVAGCEAEKPNLHIALLKDSYYNEADESLALAKKHTLTVFDGEELAKGNISKSFSKPLHPGQKFDLIVTECHHNILEAKKRYRPENVIGQIETLLQQGLLADKCTLVLDVTVDLELSDDIRKILHHPKVKALIKEKKLNVVLLKSAQKFDMLGLDNYYGGVTVSINHPEGFAGYNARLDRAQDQLRGLCYQGLAHLHKYASRSLDDFRLAVMQNTQALYDKIPKQALYSEGSKSPMQVSLLEDNRLFFIDIKFPNLPKTQTAFRERFVKYVEEQKLPCTFRASFGFMLDNLTTIAGKKLRLSPGLEDPKDLARYQAFFTAVQNSLVDELGEAKEGQDIDALLSGRMSRLKIE